MGVSFSQIDVCAHHHWIYVNHSTVVWGPKSWIGTQKSSIFIRQQTGHWLQIQLPPDKLLHYNRWGMIQWSGSGGENRNCGNSSSLEPFPGQKTRFATNYRSWSVVLPRNITQWRKVEKLAYKCQRYACTRQSASQPAILKEETTQADKNIARGDETWYAPPCGLLFIHKLLPDRLLRYIW